MRKYFFDENYFETIDNEKKAYWLGFITADGSITSSNKETKSLRLRINIHERDKSILEMLKNDLNATVVIKHFISKGDRNYRDSPQVKIELNSNKLCEDLIRHGLCQNKTYGFELPQLKTKYIRHYLRGYFDGDGHVGFVERKNSDKTRFNFEIVSKTIKILQYFQTELQKYNIKINIYQRKSNGMFRLMTASKKEGLKLFHYLYDNSYTYIKRKHDVFCDIAV